MTRRKEAGEEGTHSPRGKAMQDSFAGPPSF